MSEPTVNVGPFRRPVHEVAALLPDRPAVDQVLHDLRKADIDVSEVRILHGDEGARILDHTGAEHGGVTRLARFFQNLELHPEHPRGVRRRLRKQEALISVPCTDDKRYMVGMLLLERGGHAIIYFDPGTAETLTQP